MVKRLLQPRQPVLLVILGRTSVLQWDLCILPQHNLTEYIVGWENRTYFIVLIAI